LLGDADRVVQRRDRDGGRKPYVLGTRGGKGHHEIRAGQDAERIEMMLADPGRMHAKLIGVECLRSNVRNKGVGVTRIIFVVVIAEREVAELHDGLPRKSSSIYPNLWKVEKSLVDANGWPGVNFAQGARPPAKS
jgi:hypothetical protein